MTPFAIALALFAQDAAPAAEAPPAPPPVEERLPTGAPKDDYQFVAWCYGALRGYLDLHDEVMPEVKRIESQFRKPGTSLEDDLKVYADMQEDGRAKLKLFQSAITSAEMASTRPLNTVGAQAVRQGRNAWLTGPEITKARKAQEWMSWALPARCERVAGELETRSKLLGATLKANAPKEDAPSALDETSDAPTPAAEAPAESTPAEAPKDPLSDPTAAPTR
jgi:hypothetical protein